MSVRCFYTAIIGLIAAALVLGFANLVVPGQALAKSGKSSKAAVVRPDLVVDRVWMGADCKVRVKVRNKGQGSISPKVSRFDALKVTAGSSTVGEYTFRKVDPDGKLLKPGGVVTFIVPYQVQAKVSVTAIVDPDFKVKESDETKASNRASAILVPCRARSGDLPVRVSKVYVKQGTLRLVLSRATGVKLDTKIFSTLRLKVRGAGGQGAWSVAQFDSSGSLRKAGKAEFNTRLKLRKGSRVHTRLLWKGGNRMASFRVPADLSRTPAAGGMHGQRPSRRDTVTPGPAGTTVRTGGGQGRNMATAPSISMTVVSPKAGQAVNLGRVIRVEYGLKGAMPNMVRVRLIKMTPHRTEVAEGFHRLSGGKQSINSNLVFNLRLPSDVELEANKPYRVYVQVGPVRAESGDFTFAPARDAGRSGCHGCVFITSPRAGAVIARRSTVRISWTTEPKDQIIRNWRVFLLRPSGSSWSTEEIRFKKGHVYRGGTRSEPEYYIDWTVPADIQTGSVKFKVVAENNPWGSRELSGTTGVLSLPGHGLALTGSFPRERLTYYVSHTFPITWHFDGGQIPGLQVKIELMKGDRRAALITSGVSINTGRFDWKIGSDAPYLATDSGYYIRIQTTSEFTPALEDKSRTFSIAQPELSINTPRSTMTYYHGSGLPVGWSAPNLRGRVSIYLQGGNYNDKRYLLGTADATAGNFTWPVGSLFPNRRRGGEVMVEGNDFKVYVVSEDSQAQDSSDGHFSIAISPPRPSGPRGI